MVEDSDFSLEDAGDLGPDDDRTWGVRSSDSDEYSISFYSSIVELNPDLVLLRMQEGRSGSDFLRYYLEKVVDPYVLDLMSFGGFARSLRNPGVSVGLSDQRREDEVLIDQEIGSNFVQGNVLKVETWDRVGQAMEEDGRDGFDLVISRAVGGLDLLPDDFEVWDMMLDRGVNLLNDGGLMLFQAPLGYSDYALRWAEEMVQQGYSVNLETWGGHGMMNIGLREDGEGRLSEMSY